MIFILIPMWMSHNILDWKYLGSGHSVRKFFKKGGKNSKKCKNKFGKFYEPKWQKSLKKSGFNLKNGLFLTWFGSTLFERGCDDDLMLACTLLYRGFSRDVISSQFCKSSYSRPPCWFPFAWTGIGKDNKMSRYFLFSSYHYTKSRPSDKNIKTHTRLIQKFKSCYKANQKKKQVLLFFSIPLHTERKPWRRAKSWAHKCIQHRANPLLCINAAHQYPSAVWETHLNLNMFLQIK